jgi:putative transposase
VADLSLEKVMLQDVVQEQVLKPVKQREVVQYLMGRDGVRQRGAAQAARFWRSSLRYESRREPLTTLRQRPRELAQTRVRFGYRRLLVMMHREVWEIGKQPFYLVNTEEGLALRRKRPWRHASAVHRERRPPAMAGNEIWNMDFVTDQLADGRRFRALMVIDLFTRECLTIDVGDGSLSVHERRYSGLQSPGGAFASLAFAAARAELPTTALYGLSSQTMGPRVGGASEVVARAR